MLYICLFEKKKSSPGTKSLTLSFCVSSFLEARVEAVREIRTATLLTRQLNLCRLTNLAVAMFGEELLKKKQRRALTKNKKRDEDLGQEIELFEQGQNS